VTDGLALVRNLRDFGHAQDTKLHAIGVAALARPLVDSIQRKDKDLASQVRRAISSTALNAAVAQGNAGGNSRVRFESALGSLYEAKAGIQLAIAWGYISQTAAVEVVESIWWAVVWVGEAVRRRRRAHCPRRINCATVCIMNATAKHLLRDALALPADERVELAEELLASLDGDSEPNVDAAWGEEIERRARRAIGGETDAVSWEIVRARALEKIGRQ